MKLAVFEESDNIRIGEVKDGQIHAIACEVNLLGVAGLDERAIENPKYTGEIFDTEDVTFLPPIIMPPRVFAIGLNYLDHAKETGRDAPPMPVWFMKQPTSINEPNGYVDKPMVSDKLDFEVELVVIIGKTCRHVPQDRVNEVILGYTIGCDYSVRDWQAHSATMIMGKGFDTHAPIGPIMVTPDEMVDFDNIGLRCFVNGEKMQDGKLKDLIFKIPYLIEYITKATTLLPGDLIFTGTPAGVGIARNPQIWLKDGDIVRCEIDNIGSFENQIMNEEVETIIE